MSAAKLAVQRIPIDDIVIGDNRRPVDEAAVDALAQSILDIGLRTPITVRRTDRINEDGVIEGEEWTLVTGRHRLEAVRKLGHTEIDTIFIDSSEIDAELWEIAENLHRADLTKEQRYEHIRRFAQLLEKKEEQEKGKQTAHLSVVGGRGHKSIARKVADQTGVSRDTVKRALGTKPPAPPRPKVVRVPEEPLTDEEVATQQHAALRALWNRTGELARQWFREDINNEIDKPVMDARFGTNPHTGTANGEGIPAFLRKDRA